MTEKELRAKVISIMKGWIGCKESDGSHKKILDIYNSHKPLPRGAKMLNTYAWCAATVSAAFIKAGLTDIGFVECSCSKMIELYKAKGRWMETDSYTPEPGDLVMYDWDDTGKGDCTGAPEHVGLVVSVSSKVIRVIEGNKNDAVGYRNLAVNGKYIRGFCLPDYAGKAIQKNPVKLQGYDAVEPARCISLTYGSAKGKTYTVTASGLHIRRGASTTSRSLGILPKGAKVVCYGYYTKNGATIWLLVKAENGLTGYCSKKYLEVT